MNPNEARLHEVLSTLFPTKDDVVERITQSMTDEGYDVSQPVVLGHWADSDGWYLVDGHMRVKAAIQVGISNIPAIETMFRDFDEALDYAISRQRDRRNLTSAELLFCLEAVDQRREQGGDRRSGDFKTSNEGMKHGRSASAKSTGELLGISRAQVERLRTVKDHGDNDVKEALKNGTLSINGAYEETQQRRRERGEIPKRIKPTKDGTKKSKTSNEVIDSKESPKPFKEALTSSPEEEYTGPGHKLGITQEYADALAQSKEIEEACPEYTVAYRHANAAINHLDQIGDDDPLRDEALQLIQDWLDQNRSKK